jgi:hypothetical protein
VGNRRFVHPKSAAKSVLYLSTFRTGGSVFLMNGNSWKIKALCHCFVILMVLRQGELLVTCNPIGMNSWTTSQTDFSIRLEKTLSTLERDGTFDMSRKSIEGFRAEF